MQDLDYSKLSKKERKKLKQKMEKTQQQKYTDRSKIIKWGIIGIIILTVLAGGWWVVLESTKPLPGEVMEDQGRKHVTQKEWEEFKYNSNPPTSGPHDPDWIRKGIYDTAQKEGYLIHSLEHGYIIISYNCEKISAPKTPDSCKDLKKQLAAIAEEYKIWKLIVAPRPQLDVPIALTAWTRIYKMEKLNKDEIARFIDAYRDSGPEQTMEP